MSKITMDKIAAELGISKNTVSRALRGLSGVSDSVREQIITQAEDMGYRLKLKQSSILNIIMVHRKALMDDIFFWPSVLSGIMNFAADQGVSIRVVTVDNGKEGGKSLSPISAQKCDGLLVVGDIDEDSLYQLSGMRMPMVAVDYFSELVDCDYILSENKNGIYKALKHLIDNNHTKIGFIGNADWRYSFKIRYEAFRYYMEQFGLPINEDHIWMDPSYTNYTYFREKIRLFKDADEAATAWVCINDVMAADFAHVLQEEGYSIPDDVSIIGFDNSPYPGAQILTTLEVQVKALGQRAIEQLLFRIDAPDKPNEILSINTTLVIRDSVKCLNL